MEYRAGMFFYSLAFLLGVVSVQQLSVLPTQGQLFLLLSIIILPGVIIWLVVRQRQRVINLQVTLTFIFILLFTIGFIVSALVANQQLSYRLDDGLTGKNLLISGHISNVPVINGHVQRFEFNVENYRVIGTGSKASLSTELSHQFPRKLRLSWYYGIPVNAAEKWQLEVRLKPPHGFMNPGGFDYEAWLFQHRIHATGYVRKSALNNRQTSSADGSPLARITVVRQSLARQIDVIADHYDSDGTGSFGLIKALAIGDKSSISKQQWRILADTGTSHLMAISGLHIGLAALFAYVLIRRSVPAYIAKQLPAQHIAVIGGLIVALLYALIAGLSIPTQRAIIMLFVLSVMILIRRNHRPVDALGFALLLVLLADPLAVLSIGFWFSFSAVAVIFISLSAGDETPSHKHVSLITSLLYKISSIIKQWVRLQLLISIFLMPLSLYMFQQVSLISPIANLVLIPYVSFLVVPVVLLAITTSFISSDISEVLFHLSADLLDFIWPLLSYFSAQPYALWVQGDVGIYKLVSAITALCLFYFSKSISGVIAEKFLARVCRTCVQQQNIHRSLLFVSILMFAPIFINGNSKLKSGEYSVTVLDVGQGSAAVLETKKHVVVFDTGAKFSDTLDAGSSVVLPYLRSQGIRSVDRLIISHGDNDHIGGAQAVIDVFPETDVVGQDIVDLDTSNKQACVEGSKWQWDGVYFEFLSPIKDADISQSKVKRNNKSCVLRVSSDSGVVLFTGDIEKKVEQQLLRRRKDQLESDILIVPHHGSKTSSSAEFINAVGAKISLISVGYRNRYKLPNSKVLARYVLLDSEILRTDINGAITINLSENDGISIESYRDKARKYWHHVVN